MDNRKRSERGWTFLDVEDYIYPAKGICLLTTSNG